MINRIVIGICALVVLCIALAVSWLLGSSTAYDLGYAEGKAAAAEACQQAQLDALEGVIDSTKGLIADANAASQELGKTISARRQADAQTTKEIRHALATTAPQRAGCVFDAGVMQQLDDARRRAAEAAAGGVRTSMPAAR
ncbi:hypothetical protein [Pseudomonas sihuiensis]|uniref:Uncharacterized protein n=1 Tax=Pseudomonas sihuiensis TaxID=1274359 RepID=A0A1H2LPK0_9PSED|nr:hypothetical protein [Pseudomonas sihuiensis]SDU82276.1 hypothetical protein SAMN05216363_1891 [Pseudomonas sihuiensis]